MPNVFLVDNLLLNKIPIKVFAVKFYGNNEVTFTPHED